MSLPESPLRIAAISSGVAQVVSAYPSLFPYRVALSVGLLLLIMLAIMIVLDVFMYRRGMAAHPSPT